MKSILDPSFVYTNSVNTDIRKLFKEVRDQIEKEAKEKRAAESERREMQRIVAFAKPKERNA